MTDPNFSHLRVQYDGPTLRREDASADPLALFDQWLRDAVAADIKEPNAVHLATATPDGIPSGRMVLLKGVDRGFCFFTNYESAKGQELAANPRAAMTFYWDVLYRQVRITGAVERLSAEESLDYFHSRPKGHQLSAWASPQSRVVPNRAALLANLAAAEARFIDLDALPLPPFWGGYRLLPQSIEFWQGQRNRLHDRLRYTRQGEGDWVIERLAP